MGCAGSKEEDSPVLALCRERRNLIRTAVDGRYALASAHAAYFHALAAVGDALHRFARDELIPISTPPSSPHLTLPSSEGKPKPSRSSSNGAASSSSATPLSHSLSFDGSHLHLSSNPSPDANLEAGRDVRPQTRPQSPSPSPSPPRAASTMPSPYYNYMRSSAIPTMVYEENPYGYSYAGYGDYGYGYPPYGVPIGSPDRPEPDTRRESSPPPPPPAAGSSWGFFNLFDSYEQYLPEYSQFRMSSAVSSPDSNEVREKEGIPDLEDETEPETLKKVEKERKKVMEEDSGAGPSKAVAPEQVEEKTVKDAVEEKEIKESSSEGEKSKGSGSGSGTGTEEGHVRRKSVSFEEDVSLATEASGVTALSVPHAMRNVMEAVEEIKEQFRLAAKFGQELSVMLEVGKLRYRNANGILRAILSWILDFMALPVLASSQNSPGSALKLNNMSYTDFESNTSMKSGNLSTTLEKLYEWEKKLYKEIKEEERLRVIYDKKYMELKALDDSGAEPYKIDAAREQIRKLRTRISIILKSVDVISMRMHRIRDEELQPQLTELIQGLIKMWKFVLECHQKQFQAIVESQSQNFMAKTAIQRNSVDKVTMELEQELLRWCSCFNEWIQSQKSYIESLNGWLIRWLPREVEVTADGVVPFSPSRIGAPAIFIISNDWFHAMQRISEVEVIRAMRAFAANVHELWESQDEEQRQKVKAEYLSRDYSRRLKSLQQENGSHGHLNIVLTSENGETTDDRAMALDSMKKRLDEERAKHAEAVKQVQEVASSSLRNGLVPIFEALKNFTMETLKAYEGLRMPDETTQSNVG
ncbi:hypothetical protein J5N97_012303 [Dioscorea zingiberensis]|uniref:Nitrate regulatory gene2 protein n=1 Tax=Dioscorea zingiberensis TaxID=325984 RepID=A0A9D5CPH1_9LILI|nr:hypothetical protein J5N97_012303 [Dioscorea zingiberensis]